MCIDTRAALARLLASIRIKSEWDTRLSVIILCSLYWLITRENLSLAKFFFTYMRHTRYYILERDEKNGMFNTCAHGIYEEACICRISSSRNG